MPQQETYESAALRARAADYFRSAYEELATQVDRMMSWLLAAEWVGLMAAAVIVSPRTWSGPRSSLHPHLIAAILAGPAFVLPAIAIGRMYPARSITRHVVAVAQILVSILLIDVTGGRIETHFHIFGSLAFLAFYRDWPVLITASTITAIDHVVRGIWWPQSVYGVVNVSPWRWVEHAWWVAFEDFFLIISTRRSIREMWAVARSRARLFEGAYHDALTGLGNRRFLQKRFTSWLSSTGGSTLGAVLFVDLDKFKQANDTLGHTIGDKLLELVGTRLSEAVKPGDTLARIGGDEFVVFLKEIAHVDEAGAMGARLLAALAKPFDVDGHRLLLSASVGISLCPDHGRDLSVLQEKADKAMYVAKSQGRNQCAVFSAELARRDGVLQEIGRDIYHAQARRELRLHFQPLIRRDGQVVGFEALLRWTHPVHGQIAPSDFIPIAEKSGSIIGIGEWVLAEACRNCKAWQRHGQPPIGVAVNLSPVQFDQADFPERMLGILQDSGMDPSLLTLELTESVLVRDIARAQRHLGGLRALGVRVALDDFGTGYSSLSYLTTIPADTIKLDRSFINREFANASAVIESIIEMAHRLGLSVVGEGIESSSQSDRLLNMNCDELQGFYFSRPIPADLVEGMIESNRAGNTERTALLTAH